MSEPPLAGRRAQRFRWTGEDAEGRGVHGEATAVDAATIRAQLRQEGLLPNTISPISDPSANWFNAWRSRRRRDLRRLDRAEVCESLATLIEGGLPLDQALEVLSASKSRSRQEHLLFARLTESIRSGAPLDVALLDHPEWFDPCDAALIHAGLQSGDVVAALRSMSAIHSLGGGLRQRLGTALAYPALVGIVGVAAWLFLSHSVLPQLIRLLDESSAPIPGLTLLVANSGQALLVWWPFVAVVAVASSILVRWGVTRIPASHAFRRWWSRGQLARLLGRMRTSQLAYALSRLLRSGVPLAEACRLTADTVSDPYLRQLMKHASASLGSGVPLSQSLSVGEVLDHEFTRLVEVGEHSGELPNLLDGLAKRYQAAADRAADRLSAILGPLATILLAAMVGTLAMACVLPLAHLGSGI